MYAIVKRYPEPEAEITTLEIPKAGESQVLVKVKATSICGTDIHIWDWNQWAQNRVKKLPIIFGHEVAGEVVQVGQNVTDLREGDMISAETHIADGTCYQCRTDRMHICQNLRILGVDTDGVFAEYFSLPEENAWKNDPRLEPVIASVQEPLGNAVQAVLPKDHIADIAEKNVAVMGCGPIGLMSIAVLKELGAAKILATAGGSNKVRMELAKEMGADVVLSARDDDKSIVKTMRDATDGNGVDVVLEMSGASAAIKQALEVLTPGGRISLLGIFERPVELDLNDALIFKGATVFGITGRRMFQTWYQVKDLLANSRFREKISRIITHRLPMRDIAKGVDLIKSKQTGKVSLEPKW
ncbi:MAG: L-threonine 3-dehydrogenase [Candidatus Bathyarchaeota archaeon]|nr:L-threonine 3-dehydrogenase [Candidatus Bathyarchaeota archaeon]UCC28502.1 MAG: L-threonine 3-dehydrogenase [Candidatus Bathyarchaeota archaeon]UCD39457.1 MAG: L-threonine 3-dehydrogenase [Candidatus Bathyarchaeota archaeon]